MASQEDEVEGATSAEDAAKFSGAWDELDAADAGQSAPAAERQGEGGSSSDQEGDEAGQGEAGTGQSDADASPGADAGQPASRETSDDVWASADPKLREAHENALKDAEEKARRAEHLARSNGGRLAKALTELSALRNVTGDGTASGADDTAKQRKERIDKVREDYPEVAEPLIEEIASLRAELGTLSTSARARAESEVAAALGDEHSALVDQHPDVPDIVKAPEYAAWLQGQPPSIQRIVQENAQAVVSAADAAMVFERFKTQTGWKSPDAATAEAAQAAARKRAQQLDAGRSASGGRPSVSSDTRTNGGTFGDEWDALDAKDRRKAASRK